MHVLPDLKALENIFPVERGLVVVIFVIFAPVLTLRGPGSAIKAHTTL